MAAHDGRQICNSTIAYDYLSDRTLRAFEDTDVKMIHLWEERECCLDTLYPAFTTIKEAFDQLDDADKGTDEDEESPIETFARIMNEASVEIQDDFV